MPVQQIAKALEQGQWFPGTEDSCHREELSGPAITAPISVAVTPCFSQRPFRRPAELLPVLRHLLVARCFVQLRASSPSRSCPQLRRGGQPAAFATAQ